jgi:hypothetical protein
MASCVIKIYFDWAQRWEESASAKRLLENNQARLGKKDSATTGRGAPSEDGRQDYSKRETLPSSIRKDRKFPASRRAQRLLGGIKPWTLRFC